MKTVGYLRLSKEDGDDESSSITNQRKILNEFASNNNLLIDEFFIDDGYSGYTMNRPSLNRLKDELNENKIHTIIVKDLSRLGRHNAKVQLFLENIIEDGKRVIAPGDNYDTYNESSHDMVGVQTWMNEKYIRDTSKKIRKSITSLQKEGKWLCSVPYGYKKDLLNKTKYYIDPVTSQYVKQIFDMYISGMGLKHIARELTAQNIPTPSMIKKQNKEARGMTSKIKPTGKWDVTVISRMLQNEFYTGTLILGKSKSRSINGKRIEQPVENRYIFENAHEPIIDKTTFNLVQEITKERSFGTYRGKKIQTRPNIFSGTLYCADCGLKLTSAGGKGTNTIYVCKTYNIHGTSACSNHSVSENELKEALIDFLENCIENLSNIIDDIDNIIQSEIKYRSKGNGNIDQLNKMLQEAKKSLEILIEQKVRETMKSPDMVDIIDKMYAEMQNEKYKEIQMIEKQLEDMQSYNIDDMEIKRSLSSAMNIMHEIISTKDISKKQILILIDKITVYEDSGIDIYLKADLHKLCNNYFKLNESKRDKIKKLTYDFIINNPDKFTTGDGTVYIRSNGIKISYKTFSKFLKDELLSDGIIEIRPMNNGYKLVKSKEELERKLLNNNVVGVSRWLCYNNEIFDIALKVNDWVKTENFNKNYINKKLF